MTHAGICIAMPTPMMLLATNMQPVATARSRSPNQAAQRSSLQRTPQEPRAWVARTLGQRRNVRKNNGLPDCCKALANNHCGVTVTCDAQPRAADGSQRCDVHGGPVAREADNSRQQKARGHEHDQEQQARHINGDVADVVKLGGLQLRAMGCVGKRSRTRHDKLRLHAPPWKW